jgi:hypothetical protein
MSDYVRNSISNAVTEFVSNRQELDTDRVVDRLVSEIVLEHLGDDPTDDAITAGVEQAIDACGEDDFEVLVDVVRDRVSEAIAGEAKRIALRTINDMAQAARKQMAVKLA